MLGAQNPSVHLRDAATGTTLSSYTANQRNREAWWFWCHKLAVVDVHFRWEFLR